MKTLFDPKLIFGLAPRRSALVLAIASVVLSGCANLGGKDKSVEAPPTVSFETLMDDASKAKQTGDVTKARDAYRKAATDHPTRKEPWSHLAESYFEAGDYGNSILAAQEVLQRDRADTAAQGLLAVSGLRVSTSALGLLRQQKSLSTDTRGQAEEIVKSLREVLGEPVLVPPATPPANPRPASARRPAPLPSPASATPAPTPSATPAPAPAARPSTPAPAPAANPFDRLPGR